MSNVPLKKLQIANRRVAEHNRIPQPFQRAHISKWAFLFKNFKFTIAIENHFYHIDRKSLLPYY